MTSSEDLIAEGHYIEDWNVEECGQFVADAGFPQYTGTFTFNKVSGPALWALEQRHLSSLGIRSFAEQKKIMGFLKGLRSQEEEHKVDELRQREAAEEEARRLEMQESKLGGEDHWLREEEADSKFEESGEELESRDTVANISSIKFDALEQKVRLLQKSPEQLADLWDAMDGNGNGRVSLAEIDRLVVMKFPILNNKNALMRAYKYTTLVEGDKDAWVEKKEFPSLLKNLFFFNKLWNVFSLIDSGRDRRMDIVEFSQGLGLLGLQLNKADTERVFNEIDRNGGGQVLFDEFCAWVIQNQWDVD
eukprot:INCI367.1.p1 GENE.INCI367.1~~INCI367.1.p1  ORF type:complete len:328 (-),score=75.45 INCI367.1:29-943(-)